MAGRGGSGGARGDRKFSNPLARAMSGALILCLALLLDGLLGEPAWLWSRIPHPAVLIGRLVALLDARLNRGAHRRLRGVAAVAVLALAALTVGYGLRALGPLAELLGAAILLAQRSLVQHLRAVADGLRRSLPEGRAAVARIVSRDTSAMDAPQVARAAIESGAENFSDGVIAPAFWFLIGGLPGMLLYKAINTADSMIGYRTPRYTDFGWATARLDDLLNLIPARLSALLLSLRAGQWRQWRGIIGDARGHRSPNAGWPEAAMARALNVALAGPRSYDGRMRQLPWVNGTARRDIGADQIAACVEMLWWGWGAGLLVVLIVALV